MNDEEDSDLAEMFEEGRDHCLNEKPLFIVMKAGRCSFKMKYSNI